MFSIAVVIFREVFEISLIVGVLMAATKGLEKRGRWVALGVLGGVLGSALLALFTDRISQAAEGMGQEMLNAMILLIAAGLIGWTVVWMNHHGREFNQRLKQAGQSVITGEKPIQTLAVVVALTVLREGSEIVMFTYSAFMTRSTQPFELIAGLFLGAIAGATVGLVLYFGLIRVPIKQIFSVTSWLLVFLVAGMISKAAGYLTAAGKLPEIIPTLWDSSKLLPEQSIIGKFLQVLAGYTERPSGIQVLLYAGTIVLLAILIKSYTTPVKKAVKSV